MKKLLILLSLVALTLCLSATAFASADIKGMGNAPGPAAPGDNGIEWNPAAIDAGRGVFVIDVSLLNATLWTNALSVFDYLNYGGLIEGTDSVWDDQDIEDILAKIPEDGFSLNADVNARPKLIIGPVGFSVGAEAHATGRLDKDIFNILLKGTAPYVDVTGEENPEKLIDLTDTKAEALVYGDGALTLALPLHKIQSIKQSTGLDELYIGGSYHYVMGSYAGMLLNEETKCFLGYDDNGVLTVRFADKEAIKEKMSKLDPGELYPLVTVLYPGMDPQDILNHVGVGSAVDFGIYARKNKLSLGASIMNLGSLTIPGSHVIQFGLIADPSNTIIGANPTTQPIESESSDPFSCPLPWRASAGLNYKVGYWLSLGAMVSGVKTSDRFNTEVGTGLEFNPLLLLPLRAGINYSFAKDTLTYTAGLGLHLGPLQTDLSAAVDVKSVSVGLNTSIEF